MTETNRAETPLARQFRFFDAAFGPQGNPAAREAQSLSMIDFLYKSGNRAHLFKPNVVGHIVPQAVPYRAERPVRTLLDKVMASNHAAQNAYAHALGTTALNSEGVVRAAAAADLRDYILTGPPHILDAVRQAAKEHGLETVLQIPGLEGLNLAIGGRFSPVAVPSTPRP